MKDFFFQSLNDLESLTGIRQLYYLTLDPDGPRKIDVLIKGMVWASSEFPYISDKDQQRIVTEMMVKDQDYDQLNSRTVWKWLNQNKDFYFAESHKAEETPTRAFTAEESERVDRLINEYKARLLGQFTPTTQGWEKVAEQIKAEDEARGEGQGLTRKAISVGRGTEYFLLHERKMAASRARGLDKLDFREITVFEIEGQKIAARTEDEAREIYLEVYI